MIERIKLLYGTRVNFDIAQGLDIGKALIIASHRDPDDPDNYLYRLDVYEGSSCTMHRNKETKQLWVNASEVKKVKDQEIQCDSDDCNYFNKNDKYDKCCDCCRNDTSNKDDALDHYESE